MNDDDWFVPGIEIETRVGGCPVRGVDRVRLRPPKDWLRVILELNRTPPSMNENKIRSHWRGFHTEKKSWELEIGQLLMVERVPRDNQRAIAGCFLRLPRRAARRDEGNFSHLVNKALGDALVVSSHTPKLLRYIPDDHKPFYQFGGVEFEEETGPARTRIVLFLQPKEEG